MITEIVKKFMDRARGIVPDYRKEKYDRRKDLYNRSTLGHQAKDLIKSQGYENLIEKYAEMVLIRNIGKLLNPDSLSLSEASIKATMSEMQGIFGLMSEIGNRLEDGKLASEEIERLEKLGGLK